MLGGQNECRLANTKCKGVNPRNLPLKQSVYRLFRWSELTRKIELWVEIQELTELGEYAAVEVVSRNDVLTGGVYQLRQGQQRRIQV